MRRHRIKDFTTQLSITAMVETYPLLLRQAGYYTGFIFSSDNGYLMGEHGLSSKWLMHEESIRVPMLIADPRLPTGTRERITNEMALNIDIAPTVLDLAGVVAPERMQGRSLLPLLSEPGLPFREDWFYESHFAQKRIESTEGVRGRRSQYIRCINQEPPYEQLFDLEADPLETRNLATIASHGATRQRSSSSRLATLRRIRSETTGPALTRRRGIPHTRADSLLDTAKETWYR